MYNSYRKKQFEFRTITKGGNFLQKNMISVASSIKSYHDKKCDELASKYGLTNLEVNILIFLDNNPAHNTAKEICLVSNLSKSSVSEAVDSLTKKGFIRGEQDKSDRRYIHLIIENRASSLLKDSNNMREELQSILLKGFSKDELAKVDEFFNRIIENAKDI